MSLSVCIYICVYVCWTDRGCAAAAAAAAAITVTKVVAKRPSRHFSHVPRLLKKAAQAADVPLGNGAHVLMGLCPE